jgi:sirohydrochlorin cobaltochelatase
MQPPNYPAIILVAYGSLHSRAMTTYARIKEYYELEFSGSEVRLALTSEHIRRRIRERDNVIIPSPLTALADLQDLGHRDVAIQSLQIVPGREFHEIALLAQGMKSIKGRFGFRGLEMGMPLLTNLEDCRKVSAALCPILDRVARDEELSGLPGDLEEAVVLMGHGSRHPGDSIYSQMASILEQSHRNVFLGTLEGYPGIREVISHLKESKVKRAKLIPFLLVSGGHVIHDMAGDGQDSWKSIIESEGFETKTYLEGLGENKEIIDIFIDHTRRSLNTMTAGRQAK